MSKNFSKSKLIKIFKNELKIKGSFNEKSSIYDYKNWDSLANLIYCYQLKRNLKLNSIQKNLVFLTLFRIF